MVNVRTHKERLPVKKDDWVIPFYNYWYSVDSVQKLTQKLCVSLYWTIYDHFCCHQKLQKKKKKLWKNNETFGGKVLNILHEISTEILLNIFLIQY